MSLTEDSILTDIEGLASAVDVATIESQNLTLSYAESGKVVSSASSGGEVAPAETISPPTVRFQGEAQKSYTLILTDPDAISRASPIYREFIHWVCSDLTFSSDGTQTGTPTHILPYIGPGPPHSSGLHRYVFLLYEQPSSADVSSLAATFAGRGGKRAHLSATAAEVGLGPVAAIAWCQAQWDTSVDATHESMGFVPPPCFQSPRQKGAAA